MAERILKSMCGGDETIILYSKCSRKKTVQTAENSGDVTTQTFGVIPNKDSNVPTDNTGNTIAVQESVSVWAGEQMAAHHALVFVGACGIAVRAIAPWITDKLHDSPVLVMDEQGQYVIPLLSGHVGGANELAVRLAEELGAVPVITTATDLHGSFAVDLFAKRNDLWIHNREGIARVSAKILAGEKITMSVQTGHLAVDETIPSEIRLCAYPPVEKVDVLIADNTEEIFRKEAAELLLKPKKYILGAGCKKGTDSVKLEAFLRKILEEQDIAIEQNNYTATVSQNFLQRRKSSTHTVIICNVEVFVQGYIEVHTNECLFTGKVELINCHNTLFYLKVLLIPFCECKDNVYFFLLL